MNTQDLMATRASIIRLWSVFNPSKPPAPEWVNMIAAEIDNLPPSLVEQSVSMVIRHDAMLTNAVFQIREAAARIRGRNLGGDPLDALGEEGKAEWRRRTRAGKTAYRSDGSAFVYDENGNPPGDVATTKGTR